MSSSNALRSTARAAVIALVAVVLATVARALLDPWLGDTLPYNTYYVAVAVAAWIGGGRTALFTALVGGVAALYLFVAPRFEFVTTADRLGLAMYAIGTSAFALFGWAMHRARRQAEASRDSARVTLSSIGDGVIATDPAGRVEMLNPAAELLTGWASAEAAGRPIEEVFQIRNEYTGALVDNPVRRALRNREVMSLANHTVLTARDGTERAIDDAASPIEDASGRLMGGVLIFRDVTPRRLADEALRQSEHRWKQITETLPQLVWTCAPDGRCDYLSRQWVDYTGVPEVQHLGLGWLDAVHPDDRSDVAEAWEAACSALGTFKIDFRLRRADGAYRWFKTRGEPLVDEQGRVTRWFGTNTDIEEERQTAERLRLSAERFRSLVAATISLVWNVDADGRIVATQESWSEYTGQSWDTYRGHGWLDALAPDDRASFMKAWDRARTDGAMLKIGGRLWHAASGSYRHFEARCVPVANHDGSIREWIGKFMDVEEERQAERRVYGLMAELEEADRQKDEFLATLSHELRGPMSPIRNAAAILRNATLAPPFDGARDVIERQVSVMRRLVDDLLDITRIRTNTLELRRERLDLRDVLDLAIEMARPAIDSAGHALEVSVPDGTWHVMGDRTRLAQVFANLLTNAGKFTDDGGRIHLTVTPGADTVAVAVRDHGIGIDAEHLPRVFDRFYHAAVASRHSRAGGLGIGLSLVKTLTELHDGTVSAHSDGPGTGSEFVVTLRLVPVTDRGDAADSGLAAAVPARAASRRVLVVDDNIDSAVTLATLLRLHGYEASAVHDGASALAAADAEPLDVVLLDLGMPDMDGYEVCRSLRAKQGDARLRVYALTGWGQPQDIRRTRSAGFDFHLTKPVDLPVLIGLLNGAVPHDAQAAGHPD
ncbi:MAG: PAS domain S-box protein [Vicinamibacterales bacterium]